MKTEVEVQTFAANLEAATLTRAAREYLDRKARISHPEGARDSAGRWYPSKAEWQDCCDKVRDPSRNWPWSLLTHCGSAEHVAELFGVDAADLRRVARAMKKADKE
ncbi:MAG: hypothetical protein ACYCSN_16615 [Acidobacteriaceae bacterium]